MRKTPNNLIKMFLPDKTNKNYCKTKLSILCNDMQNVCANGMIHQLAMLVEVKNEQKCKKRKKNRR